MTFRLKTINGSVKYCATRVLETLYHPRHADSPSEEATTSLRSRLKQHPCFLTLPAIALPAQLDAAAINYLREYSSGTPKALEDQADRMMDFLWSRALPYEDKILTSFPKRTEKIYSDEFDESDPQLSEALRYHNPGDLAAVRPKARRRLEEDTLKQWTSLDYSGRNCELYLIGRLAPNFASACRVLYEIRKRCPKFIPRNLFDFGSGLGTIAWAANSVWPVGCIKEHYMVEPSADMTQLSEFMFRKDFSKKTPETVFPGIYHRRFLPVSKQNYDLVVSAYGLMELPGKLARQRVLANLWNRTSNFLVFVEQGTKAGFAAILEARDWLIENGGDEVFLFAPCPHKKSCGKKDSLCNIEVPYYHFGLTRTKNEPLNEMICYLIVSRGDWRMHQDETLIKDPPSLPRLVSHKCPRGNQYLFHDMCLPNGDLERTSFAKKHTDTSLYFFLKHAKAGDLLPCEVRASCDVDPDVDQPSDHEDNATSESDASV